MCQKLAKTWLPICAKIAEILPAANFEYWKLFNQLFNEPGLGHPANYMHMSMQANYTGTLPAIIRTALADPNSAGSLITVLGHFGTRHFNFTLQQTPSELNMKVNSDAILKAIQYGHDNNPKQLRPWELIPGWCSDIPDLSTGNQALLKSNEPLHTIESQKGVQVPTPPSTSTDKNWVGRSFVQNVHQHYPYYILI
ncbi:hypothetical protein M422DRAFT_42838 [Sphaerobolus stellatus SS14]|nr:hypothetical protein M422DRAFT_42838 [Sphaerobolus stellatus SS14]